MMSTPSFALQARDPALELHAILRDLDPARWTEDIAQALRERLESVRRMLVDLMASAELDEALAPLRALLAEVEALLQSKLSRLAEQTSASRDEWLQFGYRLHPAYEQLAAALRAEAIHVPSLRPSNYRRNILHMTSGFFALGLIWAVPSTQWLVTIGFLWVVYAWTMEILRRKSKPINDRIMAFYGPVAHPHEWHRINSATWYCTALLALSLTHSREVCAVGVLVLGMGDPVAALIGRRWGRHRILNGRSIEGTAAFVVSSWAVTSLALSLCFPALGVHASFVALVGALAGALAELASRRVDDNLTIPLAAGFTAWAALGFLGL